MLSQKLADLFVEFTTKGIEGFNSAFDAVKGKVEAFNKTLSETSSIAALATDGMRKQFDAAANLSKKLFSADATAATKGVTDALIQQIGAARGYSEAQTQMLGGLVRLQAGLAVFNERLGNSNRGLQTIANVGAAAFGAIAASLGGFVSAGVQGSAIAEAMSFQFGEVSRAIAGLFAPEMQKITQFIRDAANWLRNLSEAQRETIVRWLEAAAATTIVVGLLPRVVTGVQAVMGALEALAAVIAGVEIETGLAAILPVIGLVVGAITALVTGTKVGRAALSAMGDVLAPIIDAFMQIVTIVGDALEPVLESLSDALASLMKVGMAPFVDFATTMASIVMAVLVPALKLLATVLKTIADTLAVITKAVFPKADVSKPSRAPLAPSAGGFENVDAMYNRVAEASRKLQFGKSTAERHLEISEKQLSTLEDIRRQNGGQRPLGGVGGSPPKGKVL